MTSVFILGKSIYFLKKIALPLDNRFNGMAECITVKTVNNLLMLIV